MKTFIFLLGSVVWVFVWAGCGSSGNDEVQDGSLEEGSLVSEETSGKTDESIGSDEPIASDKTESAPGGEDGGILPEIGTDTAADNAGGTSVSGLASTTVQLTATSDGKGALCLAITNKCPPSTPLESYANVVIANVDISGGKKAPFVIPATDLKNGDYVVSAYFEEVPVVGQECATLRPKKGDLIPFGNCPTFTYSGSNVSKVELVFNFLLTFDPS